MSITLKNLTCLYSLVIGNQKVPREAYSMQVAHFDDQIDLLVLNELIRFKRSIQ